MISGGRRSFLYGIGGLGVANLLHQCKSIPISARETDESSDNKGSDKINMVESLRQTAAAKGIVYGGYPQRFPGDFTQDLKFQRTFSEDYGLIVGGVFGITIGPSGTNNYDFSQVDPFFNFAQKNNLSFRCTPMFWHRFNSPFVIEKFKSPSTTNAEIDKIFTNHISTVGKKYAGKVSSWDVVNEAINVEDGRPDGLRDSVVSGIDETKENYPTWLKFLGPDYIQRAFELAHAADPAAKLVLNDYSLEYREGFQNGYYEKRRNALLALLTKLKSRGTPIHALGIQSHLQARLNKEFDGNRFRKFLKDVADLGLKIIISELDVWDVGLPQNIEVRDRIVAESYYQFLSVALDEPAVTSVINWGLSDRYTWLNDFPPRDDKAEVRPLLRDRQYNVKPAWAAVVKAIKEAPAR